MNFWKTNQNRIRVVKKGERLPSVVSELKTQPKRTESAKETAYRLLDNVRNAQNAEYANVRAFFGLVNG